MIEVTTFLDALASAMGRGLDPEQRDVVLADPSGPLIVIAGPGTGKTTAIVARALKLVFVDRWDPASLVLTTFTKKAAEELRSRLLGWGVATRSALQAASTGNDDASFLQQLDLNRFVTGTLDSLAERFLDQYRDFETVPPVVLDEFVANMVLLRDGLFQNGAHNNPDLSSFAQLHGRRAIPNLGRPHINDLVGFCRSYIDRFSHDVVDIEAFAASGAGQDALRKVAQQYFGGLTAAGPGVTDFARLEVTLLERLRTGGLDTLMDSLQGLIVDEFQDTNALQEAIYYEFARRLAGRITVVGDDDQSVYRFRGGTVELFCAAADRMNEALGRVPEIRYLTRNYRAPRTPVGFTQDFIELDPDFQLSRAAGKPRVSVPDDAVDGLPVLGVFRRNLDDLATALSEVISELVNGGGLDIPTPVGPLRVQMAPGGRPGDCAYIAHSVREWTRPSFGRPGRPRLPWTLRQALRQLSPPIQCFNPRGEDLTQVVEVQCLCGLMLECIDPDNVVTASFTGLPQEALTVFGSWRTEARSLAGQNPPPNRPTGLPHFLASWRSRASQTSVPWPTELPLIDLFYQLLTWIPSLQDDPERQVYLEVMARALTQTARLSPFSSRLVFQPPELERPSVREAIRNVFVPLATGLLSLNEDIVETLPRSALNFLTIHQAKGLEYPVVIVDVGAHFPTNHAAHRRMRFPANPDEVHQAEYFTHDFSAPRAVPSRPALDRAFDDLVRLYYVAFTRSQSLLVLAGVDPAMPAGNIRNVALGWSRTGGSKWRTALPFTRI